MGLGKRTDPSLFNQLLKLIKLSNYEKVQLNCVGNNHYAKTKFHAVEK